MNPVDHCSVPLATKATPVNLSGKPTINTVFQQIGLNCLAQLTANQDGVLYREDSEYIHQMRVAIRRLRSALNIFAVTVHKPVTTALSARLGALGNSLGNARDWDVFVEEMLPAVASNDADAFTTLRRQALAQRDQARLAARAAVRSTHYRILVATLRAWFGRAGWRGKVATAQAAALDRSIIPFARQQLDRRYRCLRQQGKHLTRQSPAKRHAARIAAKKLRYAAEFFLSLFPAKPAQRYIKTLAALQNVLGTLNDCATTRRLLATLPDTHDPRATTAVLTATTVREDEALAQLGAAWRHFAHHRTFWRRKA